jgi:hypothetical protein
MNGNMTEERRNGSVTLRQSAHTRCGLRRHKALTER